MNNATIKQTNDGWLVMINGQMYGEYKTEAKAKEIADSFRGTLAN